MSLCYSRAAGELIQLSARVSLNFGLAVGSRVATYVAAFDSPVNIRVVAFICHCPAYVTDTFAGSPATESVA